jgi:hypothetical protein
LVNALSTANVGATGKPMNIFFDNFSLEDGLQFDETFMRGLSRALVAVPFVTADAFARMCEAGSETRIDHVLLEWWLALVLAKAEGTMLRFILPIFCGEMRDVSGRAVGDIGDLFYVARVQCVVVYAPLAVICLVSLTHSIILDIHQQITVSPSGRPVVGDLFASFDFGQLPNAVNRPTYERLRAFLRDDLKQPGLVPAEMTVRAVVDDIKSSIRVARSAGSS